MVCLGEGRVYMRANLKWQAGRKEGGISSNEQAHSSHSAGALLVLDGYGQGISASGDEQGLDHTRGAMARRRRKRRGTLDLSVRN